MISLLPRKLLLLVVLMAAAFVCRGQTVTGSVRGTVTDAIGSAIPGVQVTATNIETGIQTTTTTNDSGLYSIRLLPVGNYAITAKAQGFADYKSSNFALEIDQDATINITMGVQSVNASIQVQANVAPILNQENPTLSTIIDPATMASMPMDGRNFMAATVAVPGAVHSGGSQTEQPSINGGRQEDNAMFLDGMDIYDNIDNTGPKYTPNPDAIEQMSVITSNPAAEYDNANGGIIVAVLKSGTNHFHGNGFFQLESHNMAANTWTNKHVSSGSPVSISPFTQSYFGGSIGGPIFKDRLFFFADYQGYRYHFTGTTKYSVVPQDFLNGNFSLLLAPTLLNGTSNPYNNGAGLQLYDSQHNYAPFVSSTGKLNQVPVNSTIAQALAANPSFYPAPNLTPTDGIAQNDYQTGLANANHTNQGDAKIDWKLRTTDLFAARFTKYHNENGTIPDTSFQFPNSASIGDYTSIVLNETHQFSTSGVNELRIGFGRAIQAGSTPSDPSKLFGLSGNSKVGIPIAQSYPGFINQTGWSTSAISSIGAFSTPELYTENDFLYGDNYSMERGRHLIKVGVEFLRYQQNYSYAGNGGVVGTDTYNGSFTANPNSPSGTAPGYAFADFVLGYLYEQDVPGLSSRFGQRQWRDGVFVQDDWKVLPNLTLNLGLRWDYFQPIYEQHNKMANINLATGALSYAGVAGASRALYNPLYTEFLPRIGWAYTMTPRFVVRGGYGIIDYWAGMGANLRLTQNPPFNNEFITNGVSPSTTSGGTPLNVGAGLPSTTSAAGTTYQAWDPNNRSSQVQNFSLTTEYQMSNKTSVQVGYVGSVTRHMDIPVDASQLTAPDAPQRFPNLVTNPAVHITVKETRTGAMANYNALQAQYRIRDSHGLNFTANYTYGRALSNGGQGYDGLNGTSGIYYQQDAFNLHAEYGPTALNTTHNLSGSLVYDLPFGRGKEFGTGVNHLTDLLIGGWKVAGIASVWTGMPQTLGTPANYSNQVYSFASRPNHLHPMHIKDRSVNHWFGTDVSAIPCQTNKDGSLTTGTGGDTSQCAYATQSYTGFGTAANGSEIGPGFKNIDLSGYKTFHITESQSVDFRADAFNAFNFANYNNPNNDTSDPVHFGQITSARGDSNGSGYERTLQLALNYHF